MSVTIRLTEASWCLSRPHIIPSTYAYLLLRLPLDDLLETSQQMQPIATFSSPMLDHLPATLHGSPALTTWLPLSLETLVNQIAAVHDLLCTIDWNYPDLHLFVNATGRFSPYLGLLEDAVDFFERFVKWGRGEAAQTGDPKPLAVMLGLLRHHVNRMTAAAREYRLIVAAVDVTMREEYRVERLLEEALGVFQGRKWAGAGEGAKKRKQEKDLGVENMEIDGDGAGVTWKKEGVVVEVDGGDDGNWNGVAEVVVGKIKDAAPVWVDGVLDGGVRFKL